MTALKREAIQLVEQMPEEQVPYIIRYMKGLKLRDAYKAGALGSKAAAAEPAMAPKMEAFLELERMLVPAGQGLDYDKELAEARDEKYGYFG